MMRMRKMWVVRDHGVEGKAQPGRVVAVLERKQAARDFASKQWAPSVRQELMLVDEDARTARFVGEAEFEVMS